MFFCNKVKENMANCHTFLNYMKKCVVYVIFNKGYVMSMIIKNAESLFERFENSIEMWASKVF